MRACWLALSSVLVWGQLTLVGNTQPTAPRDAFEAARQLGRGVNLGNALEAPREGEWGLTLREEYFQEIKAAGFDTVRIPIRWSAHALRTPPYTVHAEFFRRVDWAIDQALSRDLRVVINVHHYEEIDRDPAGERERFLVLWTQIAQRYRDRDARLYFELLNEPHDQLTAARWNALLQDTLTAIRPTNPTRFIIVGPVEWNSLWQLKTLELPAADQQLIVTFHYYNPFPFTHQGASWVDDSQRWLGTRWEDTPAARREVRKDLGLAAAWAKANHRPLFLGEFGAYSKADFDSRVRWTRCVRQTAEELGIAWCYWEFASGFGVYDPVKNTWREGLKAALLGR